MFADDRKGKYARPETSSSMGERQVQFDVLSNASIIKGDSTLSQQTRPSIQHIYHSTSPFSLPLIFKYGLYLSSERFTVFLNKPTTDMGWTDALVSLAVRVPSDRIDKTPNTYLKLGFPDSVSFPLEFRNELQRLSSLYENGDDSVSTSKKLGNYALR